MEAGDCAQNDAEGEGEGDNSDGDAEGDACAEEDAGEDIAAEFVGAEGMGKRGSGEAMGKVNRCWVLRGKEGREEGECGEEYNHAKACEGEPLG